MDRLTTADFNEAVRIRNRPPPGCSKSVTTEQKICARLRRLQKNPGELQKSHKNGFRSAQLPGGARGCGSSNRRRGTTLRPTLHPPVLLIPDQSAKGVGAR